jgi:hypothetical protein
MVAVGLVGGCDLPVPGEETTGGESGASVVSTGALETGGGETEDIGIELCGNGIVDAGETCDEQGQTATCDEDCTPASCGDGLVNEMAGEQCDEGGASETCNLDCTLPRCGDGVINVGGEQCDDGVVSALCDADCTVAECGDGVPNEAAGEACDDGEASAACDDDCTLATCGDGVVNGLAAETCDDGGESVVCDVDCTPMACGDGVWNATAGEQCDGAGRTAACNDDCTLASCGDGLTNFAAGEACDDAGESPSCNANCTLVACGDGVTNVTAGEACDDAGESLGCNANCTPAGCGDGLTNVTAGEACDDAGASAGCDEDCTAVQCGDAIVNVLAGEICDASELAGGTCEGLGFGVGTLACDPDCGYETIGCTPGVPLLELSFSQVKRFDFSWAPVQGAEYYRVLESPAPGEPYGQLGEDVIGESVSFEMPLHFRWQASYMLRACNAVGCTDSAAVEVVGSLVEAVGYLKASNSGANDRLGRVVVLSGDGNTLAVGSVEDGADVGGYEGDGDGSARAGAVYVFVRDEAGAWSQQAFLKGSNTTSNSGHEFGESVALSDDGSTLAVGARYESSNATGIGGKPAGQQQGRRLWSGLRVRARWGGSLVAAGLRQGVEHGGGRLLRR